MKREGEKRKTEVGSGSENREAAMRSNTEENAKS